MNGKTLTVAVTTALVMALASAGAWAHTSLLESDPPAQAQLDAAPENVELTFSEPVRLTALTLRDAGNDETRLTPRESGSNAQFSAELPTLAAGSYAIHWRVVSADTHVVSGEIEFTIKPGE